MTEKRIYTAVFFIFLIAFLSVGCGKTPEKETKKQALPGATAVKKEKSGTLTLYIWEDYIGSGTLENFEKETGVHVKEINFKTEDQMLGTIQSDLSSFDLVVASGDAAREMIQAKLLAPVDYSKIPNFKHIDKKYLNQRFDPKQQYTVPYLMGQTGMVINKKYIKENTDSWKVLWDKRYNGKLAMLPEPFEVVAAACKLLGYSINTTNPEELAAAKKALLEQKPILHGYHDAQTIKNLAIEETIWAAQIYSGEGLAAMDKNENLEYVIPREGAPVWIDLFVIPRDARHKEDAYRFLNYILRPEVIASIASEFWYATPNKAAKPMMDPEVLESASVYPPPEVNARCEFFSDSGEATRIIQAIWTELTAEN